MGDLQEPRVGVALIRDKRWEKAEKVTHRIIAEFVPTTVSRERRRMVIHYVQGLIKGYTGCQVFPYGSVPLNTYLPDGDIDLTAVGFANFEESVVNDIVSVLEREEKNRSAEFVVKDVQLIRAEVKLVKCIVQNIVVDISFNQIGGLCTLCFLEQVDRLIGKGHLFKRSIILIKAWCYYESRILGAFHGLISTYALETLVLYIFNVFHTELDGPLAVLYKFLHYFSTFDWDNYCISLNGPILISALPDIVVETTANCPGLLLGSDFLKFCSDMFSVPSKGSSSFTPKHLNIVDPLKENNNLGRSVSKGNFIRIRSAFAYGAKKLGSIFVEAGVNSIADELRGFFSNTLDRHGSEKYSDIEDCIPRYTLSTQTPASSNAETERRLEIPFSRIESDRLQNGNLSEGNGLVRNRFSGDANDHATFRFQDLRVSDDPSKFSRSSGEESSSSSVALPYYAPHSYFSKSKSSNMKMKNENLDMIHLENSLDVCIEVVTSSPAEDSHPGRQNCDLAGDYERHLDSLRYARWCYEFVFSVPSMTAPPPLPPPPTDFHSMGFRDPVQDSSHLKRNGISHGNMNGVVRNPMFYSMNPRVIPVMNFGLEDVPRQRGTGTYFPNMNRPPHGYRPSGVRGRYNGYTRSSPHSNGEVNSVEKSSLKLPSSQFLVDQDGGTPKPLEFMNSNSPRRKLNPNANGFLPLPGVVTEYGQGAQTVPSNGPSLPKGRQSTPATENLPPVEIPRPNPVLHTDRFMIPSSYHLKDEDDFPPLSV